MIILLEISIPVLAFLALAAFVLFKSLIPYVIGALLLLFVHIIICVIFRKLPDDTKAVSYKKSSLRMLYIGLSYFISGLIICYKTANSYRAFISNALVVGGPRPIGIIISLLGAIITLCGFISLFRKDS